MVKLFAIMILYKGATEGHLLKSAYDIQSYSFLQRGTVQEFMTFASKTLVERTTPAMRQSVKQDVYMCHVYVRTDNLSVVLITDHEYSQCVAHNLITTILEDVIAKFPVALKEQMALYAQSILTGSGRKENYKE